MRSTKQPVLSTATISPLSLGLFIAASSVIVGCTDTKGTAIDSSEM